MQRTERADALNANCAMVRREPKMSPRKFNAKLVWLQLALLIVCNSLLSMAQVDTSSSSSSSSSTGTTNRRTPTLRITKPMPMPTTAIPRTSSTMNVATTSTQSASSSSSSSSTRMGTATTADAGGGSTSVATESPSSPLRSSTESSSTSTNDDELDICVHGIKMISGSGTTYSGEEDFDGNGQIRYESDFVEIIPGDVILSVLTTDPLSVLFVVDRINYVNFIEEDFAVGIRAITVDRDGSALNLLLQEIKFQEQCISHTIGIFVDFDIYHSFESAIKDLEYNIWPISSINEHILPRVAHLLYDMPWGDRSAAVEVLAENTEEYDEFMEAARKRKMCPMHFKSADNIYILFGNKMAPNFKENGTVFAIPNERADRSYIYGLPNLTYVLMDAELDTNLVDQNSTHGTLDTNLKGKKVLPSRVLAFARPFLDLMRWLKASLLKNCPHSDGTFNLDKCDNVLTLASDWQLPEYQRDHSIGEILGLLHMANLGHYMNFKMYQIRKLPPLISGTTAQDKSALDEEHVDKREIASQNFITNYTTYYFHNRENYTSLELKTKFGQVFNCQYSDRENSRHPYLFDGESVMFWRIKPDTWVATGYTASILGVIITLAILVFIVVRISLGDVFEGNPVTSILLLISLILLFISFVPFSMEYVGEHRNSQVTFEDTATLNTLCAVRVFILTLVYCFTFSLLLCRSIMLASIGSEGGFLSHVNGYLQAVICIFSVLVQLCMSIQLLVAMHIASESVSCENIYYGHWLWGLIAYDFILLGCIVGLVPFIYRSQRNYREGILIVIAAVLTFIIWMVWMIISMFGDEMRDAAIPLGMQATGWAILVGILIPRTFLIVRGIERSDIAQALPSLTSLAFAQNNQYTSEQSVYECVNPAMRQCSAEDVHQSPSEIPTLPLRGGGPRRQQFFANLRQANANINPQRPPPRPQRPASPNGSMQSSLPPSPDNSKITRF